MSLFCREAAASMTLAALVMETNINTNTEYFEDVTGEKVLCKLYNTVTDPVTV